ncbi:MAG: chromosomal replication initiator protein DnaA [bacterium]
MPLESVWKKTLSLLEKKMNRPAFELFMKRIVPVSLSDNTLYLKVPGALSMNYLDEYKSLIEDASSEAAGTRVSVIASHGDTGAAPEPSPGAAHFPLPPAAAAPHQKQRRRGTPFLNPKYTFENFVVGSSNRLCHAASLSVAEAPGKSYNPLFIYGGVGLGKTHVMQAIGHYIINTKPHLNLDYVTTDAFIHEMMNFVQEGKLLDFRNKYLRSDVLLIDDIQFVQGREGTQYEFFQIFNSFYESKKQIVITCDRLPKDIPTLEDRLVSRLNWGLIADIKPPDFETRLVILKKNVENSAVAIPEEALELIASTVKSNIRDLEGTLNRVIAHASLSSREITTSLTREIINDIVPLKAPLTSNIQSIINEVSVYFGVEPEDLIGRRRKREIVMPRMIAMFLAREMTDRTLSQIGKEFGNKDHSSVLYSCEKIERELQRDSSVQLAIDNIKSRLI